MFRHGGDGFGDLRHITAGFLNGDDIRNFGKTRQRCRFKIRSGASGDVVEDHRFVADGFGDRLEMAILAFLRGLVVVRRGREDRVDARTLGEFFGFGNGIVRGIGGCARHDRDASRGDFDGGVDDMQPFVVRESRSFAGGAAGNKEINAGFDLPGDEIAQGYVVDGAILMKGRYKSGATSTKLHRDKIARMGIEGKLCERGHSFPGAKAPISTSFERGAKAPLFHGPNDILANAGTEVLTRSPKLWRKKGRLSQGGSAVLMRIQE